MVISVSGVIAIIIAYLLGSFPSAYIFTRLTTGEDLRQPDAGIRNAFRNIVARWKTGKDIRQLGGGNAGARNVLREVGRGGIPPCERRTISRARRFGA